MGKYEDSFREILKKEGVSQVSMAEKLGMSYGNLRDGLWRGGRFWCRSFVIAYNLIAEKYGVNLGDAVSLWDRVREMESAEREKKSDPPDSE